MSNRIVQQIYQDIPLIEFMKMQLEELTRENSLLSFPLGPNHNHKGTAFGGSLYSASVAACYTLLFHLQTLDQLRQRSLVIAEGEMKYLKPVDRDFFVEAKINPQDWQKLLTKSSASKALFIFLKAEIKLKSSTEIYCRFLGKFAFVASSNESHRSISN